MGESSKIEWTDHSFNPWIGCTKVSPGCDNCYAEGWAKRSGLVTWGGPPKRTSAATWRKPLQYERLAAACGVRPRVFCASLADVFDNQASDAWRADLFELIRATPHLDWLLLTKRIGNVKSMVPWYSYRGSITPHYHFPPNVWLGISVVNQEEAERDIPKLLELPARVRFLSCEPLLGRIDLAPFRKGICTSCAGTGNAGEGTGFHMPEDPCTELERCADCQGTGLWEDNPGLSWVIVGGESGSRARPMEQQWAIDLVAQCQAVDTPVFMKQGSQANWQDFKNFDAFPPPVRVRQWPDVTGRQIDG